MVISNVDHDDGYKQRGPRATRTDSSGMAFSYRCSPYIYTIITRTAFIIILYTRLYAHSLSSLLQYVTTRSARIWDVMKNMLDLAMTPQHRTIVNVVMYASIFSMRTVNSRHAWLAIDPLSLRGGKSRKTSHALVSARVRWLKSKKVIYRFEYRTRLSRVFAYTTVRSSI